MILIGNASDVIKSLPDESVNCIVTSPPYYGLRDYGVDGQIGLEPTLKEYLDKMVLLFDGLRRVLRKDGTCWVNMGDSYSYSGKCETKTGKQATNKGSVKPGRDMTSEGMLPKNLMGVPWRLAFALQDAGWYLRSDIIWHKPNPMPESVTDRPTKAHEYIFLLTKSDRYWYDADAVKEKAAGGILKVPEGWDNTVGNGSHGSIKKGRVPGANSRVNVARNHGGACPSQRDESSLSVSALGIAETRNARTVWTIPVSGYTKAHFATFPPEIPKRCILAGCPEGGTVLDPFAGSGTTIAVAKAIGRIAIGIELNPEYAEMARQRVGDTTPSLFMG